MRSVYAIGLTIIYYQLLHEDERDITTKPFPREDIFNITRHMSVMKILSYH